MRKTSKQSKKDEKKTAIIYSPGINTPTEAADPDIDSLIKDLRKKDELLNIKKTLLKKEEWGLLTVLNLMLAAVFPAYFVNILLISFFTEIGHFWTTHLTEKGRMRLIEFEKEFRKGYELEKQGRKSEAVEYYSALIPKYSDHPKIAGIAASRIEQLKKEGGR
ncbi:MAG TPA: hypothetical protein P5511_04925 [Candidatus Goldiibacteriota bacterium]|nr:hypothetical protein [Candidatus Goldiibacteriota bacterium]